MKTLVIHPKDITTDFLTEVYYNKSWTIEREKLNKSNLKKLIKEHDRIIMLGHGTEFGLLGQNGYVIDSKLVYLLKDKECVCVWCNADVFVNKYDLKGFYTGMIISEMEEAEQYNIDTTLENIVISNNHLAFALREELDYENPAKNVKQLYYSNNNDVVKFNRNNIYYKPSIVALNHWYNNFNWVLFEDRLPTYVPGEQIDILFTGLYWATFVQGMYTHFPNEDLRYRLAEYNREYDKFHNWEHSMPTHWMRLPTNPILDK